LPLSVVESLSVSVLVEVSLPVVNKLP
jgi:hypothetical protein